MEERTGDFLKSVFLEAFENIRDNDTEDDRTIHEILAQGIKKAKEGFIDSTHVLSKAMPELDKHPTTQEHYLSSAYALELVSLIPEASMRALNVLSIAAPTKIDDIADKYIGEACKCYIYGMYLGSVILCRAAIEYSFTKKLQYSDTARKSPNIYELLSEAREKRYITSVHERNTIDIYRMASRCVHGREQFNREICLSVLNKTKIIIGKLLGNLTTA